MKDDYLWNKIGEDAVIEKLENSLKAFRYQEAAPPELPAKIPDFEEKNPRRRFSFAFSFAFAFASVAALILLSLIFVIRFSSKPIEEAKTFSEISLPKTEEKTSTENPVREKNFPIIEKTESVKPKIVKVRQTVYSERFANKTMIRKVRKTEIKKPSVKLTDEEKYAYDQLMLALSITNSKLKIVKDKIEGIEEKSVSISER